MEMLPRNKSRVPVPRLKKAGESSDKLSVRSMSTLTPVQVKKQDWFHLDLPSNHPKGILREKENI